MTTPENNPDYKENISVGDVHASVKREQQDPQTGLEPTTIRVFAICALFLLVGGAYLGANGGFNTSSILPGYTPVPPDGDIVNVLADPRESWLKAGKSNYGTTCVGCHGATGTGAPGIYPPLKGSEWVTGGTERLTALILHGLAGPITVNGQSYPGSVVMPEHKDLLNSEKMAQVISYIRNSWGNKASFVTTEMIDTAREKFASQSGPYTNATLPPADADLPGVLPEWAGGPAAAAAPAADEPAPAN